jgi:biopolymer transport protein ExbD
MRLKKRQQASVVFPISAMIDCTFLLLIYFMVASTFNKQEADISFCLPGTVELTEPVPMPDEQILDIRPDGAVVLNDLELDSAASKDLPELTKTLARFRESCRAARVDAMLTINADDAVPHQRVVDVLNACAGAKLENVTFAVDEPEGAMP